MAREQGGGKEQPLNKPFPLTLPKHTSKQPRGTPKIGGRSCSSASWVMCRIRASLPWSLLPVVSAITFRLHLEDSAPRYGLYGQDVGILKGPLEAAELSDTSDQRKQKHKTGKWWPKHSGWGLGPGPLQCHCEFLPTLDSNTVGLVCSSGLRSCL